MNSLASRMFILLSGILVPLNVLADRDIVVDGSSGDWAGVTSCHAESPGDGSGGIDLTRSCVENNNSSGNTGYLFHLYEAGANFPTNTDVYVGYFFDKNNDGVVTTADDVWALYFPRNSGANPSALLRLNPIDYSIRDTFSSPGNCGGPAGANGWSGLRSGRVIEMSVAYGCLGLSYGNDNRRFQTGLYPNFDTTMPAWYDGTNGVLVTETTPPSVISLTALSGNRTNTLTWTNPANHDGVLILRRAGAEPTSAPAAHVRYNVGNAIGNGQVVYVDSGKSPVAQFTDTGVNNGTTYYYKVFNHHQVYTYASGDVPSSKGILSEPTDGVGGKSKWCYSVGFPATLQPVLEVGVAVYSGGNTNTITANNPDGSERFRPVQLNGAIQGRFVIVPLQGKSGTYILVGTQGGYGYAVNAQSGQVEWTANGGQKLATAIQSQPAVQLNAYSNAAFKAAHPGRDLVFFASREGSNSNNKVVAISSVDGSVVWTYRPGDMGDINGGMLVDTANNRLWIASNQASNRPSVYVVDTRTGAEVITYDIGDVILPIAWGYLTNEAYVTNTSGSVYAYDLTTRAQTWRSGNLGTQSFYAFPTGTGFIASFTGGGQVRRYEVKNGIVSQLWSTPVTNPTGVRIEYTSQKLYVGDSSGNIHQMDVLNGLNKKNARVVGSGLGSPILDPTLSPKKLYVGSLDGRICAVEVPF